MAKTQDLLTKGTPAQLVAVGPNHVVLRRADGTKEELFLPEGGAEIFDRDWRFFRDAAAARRAA